MPRKKLQRFEEVKAASNVLEKGKPLYSTIKGNWRSIYFKNNNPIYLEIACGQGEYTVGLARIYPAINFIGIDLKGERIARGSKIALDEGLKNVAFLRTPIRFIEEFFEGGEVNNIWIVHPDPRPLERWEKMRLTYASFLKMYYKILVNNGLLRLKTDDEPFFDYSVDSICCNGFELIGQSKDLYNSVFNDEHHGIETFYEKKFTALGRKISYLKAKKA